MSSGMPAAGAEADGDDLDDLAGEGAAGGAEAGAASLRALELPAPAAGQRIDAWLAGQLPEYSRVQIKRMIDGGQIRWKTAPKNKAKIKAAYLIQGGEAVWVEAPPARPQTVTGEPIPLTVLHEDDDIVVIDKPAGLVVHPGAGVWSGTLANGLVGRYGALAGSAADRPGIVHRLDKETSGVIVAARNETALRKLMAQFEQRTVRKTYLALVHGEPAEAFTVEAPIGRHPVHRALMAICAPGEGRGSRTEFKTLVRMRATGGEKSKSQPLALVACYPKTGRTHQLRVHLKSVDCPILADGMYGKESRWPVKGAAVIERQALHAYRLEIDHPVTGQRMTFVAPVPGDIAAVLDGAGGEWRGAVEGERRKAEG